MVPLDTVTNVFTVMVPAFMVRLSHKAGFIVNVVEVVPAVLSKVEFEVELSPVATGSTRSSACEGSERYNCLTTTLELMVTICVEAFGPLQPVAVAVITVAPIHGAVYVTSPVTALIVLPAAKLVASRVYVMPVALIAEAP